MWVHGMNPTTGVITNTDVGLLVGEELGGLEDIEDLYIDLDITGLDYSVHVDNITNPFATVEGHMFPLNTDYAMSGNQRVYFPGISVYAPQTDKLYLCKAAIEWAISG